MDTTTRVLTTINLLSVICYTITQLYVLEKKSYKAKRLQYHDYKLNSMKSLFLFNTIILGTQLDNHIILSLAQVIIVISWLKALSQLKHKKTQYTYHDYTGR